MTDAKTKICAIIGKPLGHSLSAKVHNPAFKEKKLDFIFLALEIDSGQVKKLTDAMRAMKLFRGLAITMPHKLEAMKCVDKLDETAKKIGAINTIVNENGKLLGYNTDYYGAMVALKEATPVKGKKAVLVGAGGAARAIAFGLKDEGAQEVVILNRTIEKAKALAKEADCRAGSLNEMEKALKEADILVQSTSIGLSPNENKSIVPKEFLKKDLVVFDVVHKPLKTRLLREAEAIGCKTVPGYKMFLHQGARQFELWTGKKAPLEFMEKTVVEALGK